MLNLLIFDQIILGSSIFGLEQNQMNQKLVYLTLNRNCNCKSIVLCLFPLYFQMQLSESSQPVWVELKPTVDQTGDTDGEQSSTLLIKSGVVSHDGL